jgi:hypothetical protein
MKDQQNIDTEQKSKLKDSTQARKNMLANQTHRGVPVDFPMYSINENGEKDYMKEDEWKAAWDNLSEQEKLDSSSLYTSFAAVIEVQNDLLLQAVEMLEEELKINSNNPVEVTKQIVKVLREAATKRESSDNILNAIESIIDHGWVDVLPNRNTIEPILMSLVSNNLITVKRFGNAVPQLSSTGMDLVGTVRENNSATAELKTYQINENGETTPAEIITVLPKQYQKAVLAKYSKRAKRALTLFEAVEMLNEDMAREKDDPEYIEIEIFALRIPNQQMSSNDVFRVKQFYIGTKENFVYVPADIVVKVGSDFDIDKLQMYFPNMDKDFNEIEYSDGKSALKKESKTTLEDTEPEISDSELDAYMEQLIQTRQVEKEDCNKAEDGAVTANFTPGGKWETVKDLKGMPSHKEGGVDLQINKDGDVTFKNTSGAIITAAAGLVIPGGDKDKEVSTNPTPLAPVILANSDAKGPETWKYNSETEEYIAPMLKEVEISGKNPNTVSYSSENAPVVNAEQASKENLPTWQQDLKNKKKEKVDWYDTYNYKQWGLTDYSDYSSFNSAFRNAREAKEKEFVYKDKRYNTKLISKDKSDLYWESKNFLRDYYKNNNFAPIDSSAVKVTWDDYTKDKYGTTWGDYYDSIVNTPEYKDYSSPKFDAIQAKLDMLHDENYDSNMNVTGSRLDTKAFKAYKAKKTNELLKQQAEKTKATAVEKLDDKSYYFSITDSKPSDLNEEGYMDPKNHKLFITTTNEHGKKLGSKELNTTDVHELSHKGDSYDVKYRTPKLHIDKFNTLKYSKEISQETFDYLTDPTEIEARKMSTLFYLHKNKLPYTNIDKKTLDELYTKLNELPLDVAQLLNLYGAQQEDLLKYLNNDFSYLNKKGEDAKK